jgi:hypothetical protein
MFKRIIHEDWVSIIPMIAFGVLFVVFVVTTIRAIRLKPSERDRMGSLPLDDDSDSSADH